MADDNTTDDDLFLANDPDDTDPMEDLKKDEELPEDGSTPFSPPSGVQDQLDDTAQPTDTNVDGHQRYDAGIQEAANMQPPGEPAVTDYTPPTSDEEDEAEDEIQAA